MDLSDGRSPCRILLQKPVEELGTGLANYLSIRITGEVKRLEADAPFALLSFDIPEWRRGSQ